MEFALLGIAITATCIYTLIVLTLFFGFFRLGSCDSNPQSPVSIIIAARNEKQNIRTCLHAIARQDYPSHLMEVIVVDDRSSDATADVVSQLAGEYEWLKLVQIQKSPDYPSAKKWALTQGNDAASNDVLLFTDADCAPSRSVVSSVVQYFADNVGVVIGFSPVSSSKSGVWNLILGMDSLAAGFVAAGAVGIGRASLATGRNLAYRRQVFEEVDGFKSIAHSISGDDDLFLQLVKNKTDWQIKYLTDPKSIVRAQGPANILEFVRQKKRHLSAGRYFSRCQQLVYASFHISNIALWTLPVVAWIVNFKLFVFWAIKMVLDLLSLFTFAKKLRLKHILFAFPLWELFFVSYHIIIAPLSFLGKVRWKG